jgi:hypothetical protein
MVFTYLIPEPVVDQGTQPGTQLRLTAHAKLPVAAASLKQITVSSAHAHVDEGSADPRGRAAERSPPLR